jgi:hypothetical protein
MRATSVGVGLLFVLPVLFGPARASAAEDAWAELRFLIGEWEAGKDHPEKGTGRFTLAPDLNGKVLVRKNRADLPAASGRPAIAHEDLMVIHRTGDGKGLRAVYFDNEGHVIHYAVTAADGTITFLSDAAAQAPRFRLTYTRRQDEGVDIRFEIAPPGKPMTFKTYLEGTAYRKGVAKEK